MRRRGTLLLVALLTFVGIFLCACGPNESILKSNTTSSPPTPSNIERPVSSFEKDLEAMRTADFDFIFVLRRMDGGKFDSEDKGFVRMATAEANRRSLSDDDKAVIVGSNYRLAPETMMRLYGRFAVEDHSKPENEINKNKQNTNS